MRHFEEPSNDNNYDTFYIQNDQGEYFCCSSINGFYWSKEIDDPNIVDGAELEIKYSMADTIQQISEQVKMLKGTQFSRHSLFQHPHEKCWLACERKNVGKDSDGNKIKEYRPFFTRKFKSVVAISRHSLKCQGNIGFANKKYAQDANKKAQLEKKRRLASAAETAKALRFDPMRRLALYAMGDRDALGLKEDIRPSLQLKSLEIYLKYSHQQMKAFSPQEMEKLKGSDNGPKINIVLPADGSENNQHVLEHKDNESLEEYLKNGSKKSYEDFDTEVNDYGRDEEFEEVRHRLDLPDED